MVETNLMRPQFLLSALTVLGFSSGTAFGGVFYATDFGTFSNSINAANVSPDNDTIFLAPGIYTGGSLPNILADLTISLDRAHYSTAQDGSAILNTTPTGEKGILTIPGGTGINLTVDGLTFENASISADDGGNAAGIRDQSFGGSLIVSNSTFLNNQDGILTGSGAAVQVEALDISISNSIFANNGRSGKEHAIYAFGQSLSVIGSTFCGTILGHDIKSRTAVTLVTNSTLYDGAAAAMAICSTGSTSYALDLPNGGQVSVDGVQFIQGNTTDNSAIVSYGEEGLLYGSNSFKVENSTFASTVNGTGIQELSITGAPTCLIKVQLPNTTFSDTLMPVNPADCSTTATTDPPVPVDEPATLWMLLATLLGGASFWRRPRLPRLVNA
jgi:hypothetical protein